MLGCMGSLLPLQEGEKHLQSYDCQCCEVGGRERCAPTSTRRKPPPLHHHPCMHSHTAQHSAAPGLQPPQQRPKEQPKPGCSSADAVQLLLSAPDPSALLQTCSKTQSGTWAQPCSRWQCASPGRERSQNECWNALEGSRERSSPHPFCCHRQKVSHEFCLPSLLHSHSFKTTLQERKGLNLARQVAALFCICHCCIFLPASQTDRLEVQLINPTPFSSKRSCNCTAWEHIAATAL